LLGLRIIRLGLRRIRNSHYGSNGSDIGNRRWPAVHSLHIVVIVRSLTGAPKMLIVVARVMRAGAIPAIGMPMGVVIRPVRLSLGAQGA
jgi:hypothetical protein